jgi:hypothetical protein
VFQGAGWASQTSDSTHSLTVNLAPSQSVASVRLWFPSTRLPRAFRLRVGDQDIEAQKHAVTGAIEVCPGIFRAIQREVEIVFDPIEAGSVMFVQYAGGGSTTSPNSAFVNQIQARRPSEMTVVTSVYDSAGNLERRFKGQTPEETWSHPEETWSHDDRGRIVRYMRRRQGLIEENWSYEYDALGRRLWERNERTGDQEWFVYDGLSDTKIARYKKPPGQAWELDTTYVVTPDHQVLGEVQGSNKAWFLPSSDTNPLAMNQNQNLIYDELTNTFGELVHRTNFGLDPSAQPRIGFAGCEKEAANSEMLCGTVSYNPATGQAADQNASTMGEGSWIGDVGSWLWGRIEQATELTWKYNPLFAPAASAYYLATQGQLPIQADAAAMATAYENTRHTIETRMRRQGLGNEALLVHALTAAEMFAQGTGTAKIRDGLTGTDWLNDTALSRSESRRSLIHGTLDFAATEIEAAVGHRLSNRLPGAHEEGIMARFRGDNNSWAWRRSARSLSKRAAREGHERVQTSATLSIAKSPQGQLHWYINEGANPLAVLRATELAAFEGYALNTFGRPKLGRLPKGHPAPTIDSEIFGGRAKPGNIHAEMVHDIRTGDMYGWEFWASRPICWDCYDYLMLRGAIARTARKARYP